MLTVYVEEDPVGGLLRIQ